MYKKSMAQIACMMTVVLTGCITTVDGYKPPKPKSEDVRAKSYFDLGAAYIGKGRYDLAEPKLMLSLQIKPTAAAYNALAVLYEQRHDNALAEDTYKTLMNEFPEYTRGYLNYHIFLCKYDRQAQIDALNSIMISRGEPLASLGEVAAGDCALSKGRSEKAKMHYNTALQYNPLADGALLQLAKMDFQKGFVAEAKSKVDLVNNQIGYSAESVYLSLLISKELGDLQAEKKFSRILRTQFGGSSEQSASFR
ncbi:MAG: hypothetical protein KGV50_04835 [Gammaproteobacteria bacterium]|nr:hypothetical protein [Gammaproteobacteria bacterium]